MLRYYKLFDLLNRRHMKKTDLLEIISAPTLAKISKGKNIQTDAIDKICLFLECQPGDIMECFYHESEADEFGVKVVAYNKITSVGDDNEFEETEYKVDTRALPEDFEKSEKIKAELLKKNGLK